MKTINCEFDLNGFKLTEREKEIIKKEGFTNIFELMLTFLVSNKYKEGVNGTTLKTLNRIFKKLDTTENYQITLEEGEFDFIKDAFLTWDIPIPVTQVRVFCAYREIIEKVG